MPITAKATLFSNYNVIASAAKQSRSIKDCRVRLRPLAMTLRISLYFLRKKCYTRYKLIFSEVTGITMDEKEKKEQSHAERAGIDYAIKLSYGAVDKSERKDKRDLIYSLLCFGYMFDKSFVTTPDPIVKKYDCLTEPEPKKSDLYELAHILVNLPNANLELKKCWFMTFAYVLLSEAPHNPEIFDELRSVLHTEEVFAAVLASRYSIYVPPTLEELAAQGAPSVLLDWERPYLEYCAEKDEKGVTRETRECKRLLMLGNFTEALFRSERLISAFPDDLNVAISNIAARVSLSGAASADSRISLLKETLSLIDEYLPYADTQYFRYYRGLTLLGLMDTVGARREFEECLQNDPHFELAALMLKGMDKYEK